MLLSPPPTRLVLRLLLHAHCSTTPPHQSSILSQSPPPLRLATMAASLNGSCAQAEMSPCYRQQETHKTCSQTSLSYVLFWKSPQPMSPSPRRSATLWGLCLQNNKLMSMKRRYNAACLEEHTTCGAWYFQGILMEEQSVVSCSHRKGTRDHHNPIPAYTLYLCLLVPCNGLSKTPLSGLDRGAAHQEVLCKQPNVPTIIKQWARSKANTLLSTLLCAERMMCFLMGMYDSHQWSRALRPLHTHRTNTAPTLHGHRDLAPSLVQCSAHE